MLGARISAAIALQTVALTVFGGLVVGLASGFLRGWTDRILMTFSDALLAFPGILLALSLIAVLGPRSEEHTSELQSLMRISYAVFCLKKKTHTLPQIIRYAHRPKN